jgi:hypothetical protein
MAGGAVCQIAVAAKQEASSDQHVKTWGFPLENPPPIYVLLGILCRPAQAYGTPDRPIRFTGLRGSLNRSLLLDGGQAGWRRRRDSNPRYAFGAYNGLANRRLQPLGHVSGVCACVENMRPDVKETQSDRRQSGSKASL